MGGVGTQRAEACGPHLHIRALVECDALGLLLGRIRIGLLLLPLLHVQKLVLVLLLGLRNGLLVHLSVVEVAHELEVRKHVAAVLVLLAKRIADQRDRLKMIEFA